MNDLAISTHSLSRTFDSIRAVDDLSLEVVSGSIYGFLGPNGAGKTTTIRLLLGLLEPTSGGATVLGLDAQTHAPAIREQTGALLEHPGLYERLTAEENLDFYGRVWRMPVADRRARARELLEHFGLWERRRDSVGAWSRGMKQKLAVARAIFHRPRLIFFDEPTAGLDPVASAALRDDIAALAVRSHATIFLTTHNLAEAEKLCQRIGVIRQGRLVAEGHPDELRLAGGAGGSRVEIVGRGFHVTLLEALRLRPEVSTAEVQNGRLVVALKTGADAAPLVSAVVSAGAQVEEVRKGQASLEDVFLTLMQEDAASGSQQ